MKIIYTKGYENIEKRGLDVSVIKKKSNANTYSGWLLSRIKHCRDDNNLELALIYQDAYKKYIGFQKVERIRVNSWRGKGGIRLWTTPDKIMVEFAGKRGKGDKPNIQTKEYSKEEVNKMIMSINKLKEKFGNKVPSRFLGEEFFQREWDSGVFSQRSDHTKFTHLLNILDYYKIIEYNRAGYTSVVKEIRDIQEVLK